MKVKKFNELNENVQDLVNDISGGNEEIMNGFERFKKMKKSLIDACNNKHMIGNTADDLGNFIAQNIYEFLSDYEEDDAFSAQDFIDGFEHGIDSMKEPKDSKFHNFSDSDQDSNDETDESDGLIY